MLFLFINTRVKLIYGDCVGLRKNGDTKCGEQQKTSEK